MHARKADPVQMLCLQVCRSPFLNSSAKQLRSDWTANAVTHGHLDHVGAIEPLIKAYPDLKVIFHETEAPFLLGTAQPSCYNYKPNGLSAGFKLLMLLKLLPPYVQYKVRSRLKTDSVAMHL